MKTAIIPVALLILYLGLAAGCGKKQPSIWESIKNPEVVAHLKSFVAEEEARAKAVTNADAPDFTSFFAAAGRGDWQAVSNIFQDFRNYTGQYKHINKTNDHLPWPKWQAVLETWGALHAFGEGGEKYSVLFANDIIESIPAGGIYFGGTDPGWFLVAAMQKNQAAGDPFFAVPQHGLENAAQLDHLGSIYGGKIYTPTADDLQRCSQDYTNDVVRRLQNHQLKPGEDVTDVNGRVQISGYMAVIGIRERMTQVIFNENSNRQFYVEESFPLEWMYPYLEPHGIIFKLDRQPLPELSDEILQRDRDYWTKLTVPMIGDWLKPDTSVQEVTAFAEKVFANHDFSGFTGDPQFVRNDYSCKMFSKERSSIAGLYAWRARQTKDAAERKRMNAAADFAFRQAWVLCPYSMETVVRYINVLTSENKFSDAQRVAVTVAKMPEMKGQDGGQIRALLDQIKNLQLQANGK